MKQLLTVSRYFLEKEKKYVISKTRLGNVCSDLLYKTIRWNVLLWTGNRNIISLFRQILSTDRQSMMRLLHQNYIPLMFRNFWMAVENQSETESLYSLLLFKIVFVCIIVLFESIYFGSCHHTLSQTICNKICLYGNLCMINSPQHARYNYNQKCLLGSIENIRNLFYCDYSKLFNYQHR